MKILSIGNSYSQDAQRYLYGIARADGVALKCVNLYIGGCTFATHYKHMNNDAAAYTLECNGMDTGVQVSIRQALQSTEWDYVTLQQQSSNAAYYDTYEPYLTSLIAYVKLHAPKAKIALHQTWAYENKPETLQKFGYETADEMFSRVETAYFAAARAHNITEILPSGQAFEQLRKNGVASYHRDPIHASVGLGRFTLGLAWYHYLTGRDLDPIRFTDFDAPVSDEEIALAKKSAASAVKIIRDQIEKL